MLLAHLIIFGMYIGVALALIGRSLLGKKAVYEEIKAECFEDPGLLRDSFFFFGPIVLAVTITSYVCYYYGVKEDLLKWPAYAEILFLSSVLFIPFSPVFGGIGFFAATEVIPLSIGASVIVSAGCLFAVSKVCRRLMVYLKTLYYVLLVVAVPVLIIAI